MEQNRFLREYRRVVAAAADVITGPHEEMRATTKMVACYGGCEEWMQRTAGSEWSAALIRRFLATSERFSEIGTHTKKQMSSSCDRFDIVRFSSLVIYYILVLSAYVGYINGSEQFNNITTE